MRGKGAACTSRWGKRMMKDGASRQDALFLLEEVDELCEIFENEHGDFLPRRSRRRPTF
jgi:hypothetical protein